MAAQFSTPSQGPLKTLMDPAVSKRRRFLSQLDYEDVILGRLDLTGESKDPEPGEDGLVAEISASVWVGNKMYTLSSGGSDIEVVVWATSGDRENVLLRQFGDQKTKYRGEISTKLGAPSPGDRTLQIIGDDEVFYAYSERFRAKITNLGENRGGPIKIASDAMLMASARKLLSANEQRVADMEAMTKVLKKGGVEAIGDLHAQVDGFVDGERTALKALVESFALDQFEDEKADVLDLVDAVNLCHVGMVEAGQGAGLALEAMQALLVFREVFGQDLDRDLSVQARIFRTPHFAHGASSDRGEQLVVREGMTGS